MATETQNLGLFTGWQIAFKLFWQHFPLVYPIFGFFVLMQMVMPEHLLLSKPSLSWLFLFAGQCSIWFLIEAGWTYMAYETTQKYIQTPPAETNFVSISASFGVLKHFFPGVGHFGVSFLVTGFLELLMTLFPFAIATWIGLKSVGIPQKTVMLWGELYQKIVTEHMPTVAEQELLNQKVLKAAQFESGQIMVWLLMFIIALIISMFIQMSLLYWRAQICRFDETPLKSLWKNLLIAAKHPFATVGINLLFMGQYLILSILMSSNPLVAVIVTPLMMMLLIVKSIYLFLYLNNVDNQGANLSSVGTHVDVSV